MAVEILAPVGSRDSLVAAIRAGADAVYFGAEEFNARRNADNFDEQALQDAIAYAKKNGVYCYLTLNTLIKDDEMTAALSLAKRAWHYGIDAVIVQDLGLACLLHQTAPYIVLHGSTQLSIHSPAALPLLKEMGFQRIVPARELSEAELNSFVQAADRLGMEVEVFVHGALCMCLSGQCYFSAFLGGRSANRGLCAGTCRLPFHAEKGTNFDLSLKDLSLLSKVHRLTEIGVASFKIEGRMKRPEYVASAVHAFRLMFDEGAVPNQTKKQLEQIFSRSGFTDGYFENRLGRHMFGVRSEQDKAASKEAMASIHELYRRERQRLPLRLQISLRDGQPIVLTAQDGNASVTCTGPAPEKARNRPLTKERLEEIFSKLGGTPYYVDTLSVDCEEGWTLPLSALNRLRTQGVEKLGALRALRREKPSQNTLSLSPEPTRKIHGFFARFSNETQCFAAKNLLSDLTGYSLPAFRLAALLEQEDLSESSRALLQQAAAELPRGATDDTVLLSLLTRLQRQKVQTVVCSNLSAVALAKKIMPHIIFGFGMNLFNSYSLAAAADLGAKTVILSPELNRREIAALTGKRKMARMVFCYGRQPLMLTRNCPVKNGVGCREKAKGCFITDRKNNRFPVICENGFSEILNTKITNLSHYLSEVAADAGYLFFSLESPEETISVLQNFLQNQLQNGAEFTHGLFVNGVL